MSKGVKITQKGIPMYFFRPLGISNARWSKFKIPVGLILSVKYRNMTLNR